MTDEHQQLLQFLYAAPIGLLQASLDGEIELINSVSAKLLLPVVADRKLTNLFDAMASIAPDLRRQVSAANQLTCTVCEGVRYEIPGASANEAIVVSFSVMKVDGQRLIAVFSEITKLVQKERALQAGAAWQAKTDFLANMSHELRTPLNAIIGNAELMRRGGLSPTQLGRMEKLEVSAKHLLAMLTDVLSLSSDEAGELRLEETDFLLDQVLERVRLVMDAAAAAKQLLVQVETQGVPQALRGDPARLSQILVNYLSNAIKFTEHGRVRLKVALVEDAADSCELRFEVHDTGIGFSPRTAEELFTAFERGPHDASVRGAGLGLGVNARLAKLMRGKVGATCEPGKGSTFWLVCRFGKSSTTAARADSTLSAEAVLARDFRGTPILVVEDDPLNQAVAVELLEDVGLAPVLAKNGLEAVRMVEDKSFGLVLMDLRMPRLNGLQATVAIRALPGREHLPIVAMTANAFSDDREMCMAAGMNDFVGKPFEIGKLCETLLRWLQRPQA